MPSTQRPRNGQQAGGPAVRQSAAARKMEAARLKAQKKKLKAAERAAEAEARRQMRKGFGRIDVPLLAIIMLLLVFGLVMLYSASYPSSYLRYKNSYLFILPQLRFALLGLVVMLGASLVDYHILKKFAWPLMAVTVVLLVVVLFLPDKNGAHRWIWLNSAQTQSFQPSELAKFAVIVLFAALIGANQSRIKTFQYGFLPFVVILGVVVGMLLLEPHLSCSILILGIGISMMFTGGTAVRWFGFAALFCGVALFLAVTAFPDLVPYATSRIDTWLDPFSADPAKAHQTIQSLIAVGSGGITGRGIGNSVQKYLYLPEMYNDYIFAVLCEELGFVGALAVIGLFLMLLVRGLYIAVKAKDKFGSMLAVGISVQIALQALLHMAVNANLIPSTGISLPFFSSGGTSLVMLMGQMGVLFSVSRQANLGRNASSGGDAVELQTGEEPPKPLQSAGGQH